MRITFVVIVKICLVGYQPRQGCHNLHRFDLAWRRDSRLKIIIDGKTMDLSEFELELLKCLAKK